ncbi:MAG: ABC transporter permease [Candidatus Dormibacteraeota bacterium]|nr:ABC transporter permease [Candidatus Dormibacteraeota bacterium]MBV9524592.1 ABC transporter permease [Candidatus Dormibacteraeota bacterium]
MSDATVAARQVRYEQKLFWRNPASAFFAFLFPIIFLVVFATIFKDTNAPVNGVKVKYDDYYIPALVTFGVIGACFTNIAASISIRRDDGILKRLRGTPLPPWAFLAGVIGSSVIVSVLLVVLTVGFGVLVYGVHLPNHFGPLLLSLAVGAMTFCALGLAMTVAIPNAEAAPAIVNGVLLPVVFISGTFFPIDPTSVVTKIAEYFPVKHFINALFTAFDPAHQSATGFVGNDLLIMAAWGVVGIVIAVRRFRWEPRRT